MERRSDGLGVARLEPGCAACYADCDASDALTLSDFACFQVKFVASDPYVDCNRSSALTIGDFACFPERVCRRVSVGQ